MSKKGRKENKQEETTEAAPEAEAQEADFSDSNQSQNQNQNAAELPTAIEQIKIKEPVVGHLIGTKVAVREDFQNAQQFFDRSSFGEIFGAQQGVKETRIEFALDEALYLMERGKLVVFDGKKKLTFEQFVKLANKTETNFWTKYQVYRDIRTRGYITKTALKFGADYRLYPRGVKPGQDHAKWVLFCTNEYNSYTWTQFAAMNRVAHSTRKKLLVGIVDKEGEVTYYEIRWKKP
ncbi:MAG TPA: tRNA-intron lyase [Nanoarchaeota archaeon]|nr:tRNA-intron lyase [Nanoarchaeota archaeon]